MARQTHLKDGTARPLLLVDVDGVLSLFGAAAVAPETLVPTLVDGVPHLLSRTAAAALRELVPDFECVWCTGWKDRADSYLPLALGLPRGWPHIRFASAPNHGGHWKLGGIDSVRRPSTPAGVGRRPPRRGVRGLGRRAARPDAARAHEPGGRSYARARRARARVGCHTGLMKPLLITGLAALLLACGERGVLGRDPARHAGVRAQRRDRRRHEKATVSRRGKGDVHR